MCSSVELSEGLTLMEAQPHAELKRVEVGLGSQTLRLEYISDCSSYTLLLRDCQKVDIFKELLSGGFSCFLQFSQHPFLHKTVCYKTAEQPRHWLCTDHAVKADLLQR